MNELRTEPGAIDHVAGRAIDFEAAELPSAPRRRLDELDRGVAAVPGGGKHPRHTAGHLAAR